MCELAFKSLAAAANSTTKATIDHRIIAIEAQTLLCFTIEVLAANFTNPASSQKLQEDLTIVVEHESLATFF